MHQFLVGDWSGGPRLPAIAAESEARARRVLRHRDHAFAGADDSVADFTHRLDDLRLGPGRAVVGARAHDVLQLAAREMEQRPFAIPPQTTPLQWPICCGVLSLRLLTAPEFRLRSLFIATSFMTEAFLCGQVPLSIGYFHA